jgi:autotransporter passenger strand-loop-strand repeat protein
MALVDRVASVSATLLGGQETVLGGGRASGTVVSSGGYELVSSGGSAVATHISGGTLEVASGGTASGVVFSSGGILQLDASSHLSGTISGFHLGEEIDLRGLAFSSSSSTLTWKHTTSGANASGTLTVKEGTSSTTLALVGSYTVSNFSATSDGHGGTLITDPPVTSGGSVTSNTEISSGIGSTPDFASTPPLQWLENAVELVVSDLEGLKGVSGFEQLLNRIESWCSPGSGSTPSDQTSDHPIFQASGFAAGWQSHFDPDAGVVRRR